MAKDLPYFKFFCSEWNDGDITLEDYHLQGLFINICSYYWSNECNVTFTKLEKKFKDEIEAIGYLIESNLIKDNDTNMVIINFLDEQWEERQLKSKVNSVNGAKGGRPKKQTETQNKPNALNSLSETKGIKKREEKKREDNIYFEDKEQFLEWFNDCRKFIKLKSNIKKLSNTDMVYFKELKDTYTISEFKSAMSGFTKDSFFKDNDMLFPTHFLKLENFTKFLNKKELTTGEKLMGKTN